MKVYPANDLHVNHSILLLIIASISVDCVPKNPNKQDKNRTQSDQQDPLLIFIPER